MRPSVFLDGTDGCRDGNDVSTLENLKSIFTHSPIFHDHLEYISDVQKKCIMDGRTDRWTVGQMIVEIVTIFGPLEASSIRSDRRTDR